MFNPNEPENEFDERLADTKGADAQQFRKSVREVKLAMADLFLRLHLPFEAITQEQVTHALDCCAEAIDDLVYTNEQEAAKWLGKREKH